MELLNKQNRNYISISNHCQYTCYPQYWESTLRRWVVFVSEYSNLR